ncbi:N-methyl-L-tryptophan oxidase (plasmid) [Bradyrhizobium barranii subsp. apii]|uniref:N-methyl-L-tryptophan oxidase n=1 Tax=Bradyrhizobium barranii subsp. apii TaxID=2819348 RepID=A0A8T5VVS9_9BRAD|nr:N-methyl-L-tryptophan oxidase [Bradyrhizobium barranii]UPT92440.1 N-methyl-L-tryptophan oxidase [Bradyrhizobium barranii subsp. apii]
MRLCEIAIVGLGLMGSSALHSLVRRGADVLGFDPITVGEARGSSHGSCRVYRRFNFESAAYTDLSDAAFKRWRMLESASGRTILMPSRVLEAGPPGSKMVADSRAAARLKGDIAGAATGTEANAAFPAFRLPEEWDVVVQESGGILLAEAAIRAFREGAEQRIVAATARMRPTAAGIRITTPHEEVLAEKVIVAAGPWIAGLVPRLARHLKITRQPVGWFAPARPEWVRYGEFPIFIVEGARGLVYGFPDFEGRGVKAAQHDHGPVVDADAWEPPATDDELDVVGTTLADLLPGAAGPIVDRDICLYTNTLAADLRKDDGNEFIIDRLPHDPRIIVASPCSGHGAKFASAIGAMVADMALDPKVLAPEAFRLDRYSHPLAGRTGGLL